MCWPGLASGDALALALSRLDRGAALPRRPFRGIMGHSLFFCPHMSIAPSADLLLPELATPVPSPCVNLCKMDPQTGFCLGCMRTIDEIIAWSKGDDAYKRTVWAELRRRETLIDFDSSP